MQIHFALFDNKGKIASKHAVEKMHLETYKYEYDMVHAKKWRSGVGPCFVRAERAQCDSRTGNGMQKKSAERTERG